MRTRYVMRNGRLVERPQTSPIGYQAMSDIAPFRTQDGVEITSRSGLREYERRRGVRQVGNDWSGPEKPAFWDRLQEANRAGVPYEDYKRE